MQLSARAYRRILKLARTIADLCPVTEENGYLVGVTDIQSTHITEAIQSYREASHYWPGRAA
ncbi:MAG: hypothetical protein JSV03_05000 [Planctomycetota bacterium]|nr:MAG: hypothetical protein JSV03_05000 [Planctomycetota bacterium]